MGSGFHRHTGFFFLMLPRVHISTLLSPHFSFWPRGTQYVHIFMYKKRDEGSEKTGQDRRLHLLWVSSINISIFLTGTILCWLQFIEQCYCTADVWLVFEQATKYMCLSGTYSLFKKHPYTTERKRGNKNLHSPWHYTVHLNCEFSRGLVRRLFKNSSYWTPYKFLYLILN